MNTLSLSPSTFTIVTNKEAPRLTVAQVVTIIKCIVFGEPKKLEIHHRSAPQGHAGERWMEVDAESYKLGLWVHDTVSGGSIFECFYCCSPKGSQWFAPTDGGKPFSKFSANETAEINKVLYLGYPENDCEVLTAQIWRVCIRVKNGNGVSFVGGSFDFGTISGLVFPPELRGTASFATKQDAEIAATKYKEYRLAYNAEQRRIKNNPPKKTKK